MKCYIKLIRNLNGKITDRLLVNKDTNETLCPLTKEQVVALVMKGMFID